ncbi:MAG: bifunctional adenosylcobinamide kinase/adenosylcobinamide-phosphate guanylyltransferase [Syntrophobacterales bacterium]|nr:bifunctional adenosylcobinamide kinase/adenosylcobinamide-phosphate guanylyltransferase [Syntrophobacterales bacterium]
MKYWHLILGGARSGKSRYAEKIISSFPSSPPYLYVATAKALDEEMAERIKSHKARRGKEWITYEEPLRLGQLLEKLNSSQSPVLIDCLTIWLSNLLIAQENIEEEVEKLCDSIHDGNFPLVVMVSNEVGLGIVPENELARKFRDVVGWVHQRIASQCTHVTWMIAGIPVMVKHPSGGIPFSDHKDGSIFPGY